MTYRTIKIRKDPSTPKDHGGVLLLDAAHHHAEMARLDHHEEFCGVVSVDAAERDVLGEALLELQAPREHVDHARELAHAEDFSVRDVADVAAAEERQPVVLA